MWTLQGCTRLLEFIAHSWRWQCTALLLPPPSLYVPPSPLTLPLPLSLSGCLPAGQEHAIEIERTPNAALAFPDPFHDAATTHPPLSPPSLLLFTVFLLHAGRGRSVVSPGVACHLAKAVILLLAKYKSECCANYSQQGHGVAGAWPHCMHSSRRRS